MDDNEYNEYVDHLTAWFDAQDTKSTSPVRTLAIMALVKELQTIKSILRVIAEALVLPEEEKGHCKDE